MKINSMLLVILVIFSALFFMSGPEALCKTSKEPAGLLEEADQCRKSLYRSGNKKKYRDNWLRCIRRYEKVYTNYPESDQAAWAIYRSASLFTGLYTHSWRLAHLDEAIRLYRRVVDEYEDHPLADDAQYQIGEIFYRYKKDVSRACEEFMKVDRRFPSGDMRPMAMKMLDKLAVSLSKKDEETGPRVGAGPKSRLISAKDIRHWSSPNYTRVVVDLEGPVKYEHHLLKADPRHKRPRRLYLDLKNARLTTQIESPVAIKDGLLQRVRAGQFTKDTVRVVLDIESIGGYKVFHLYDPFRIVVDVRRFEKEAVREKPKLLPEKRPVTKRVEEAKEPEKAVPPPSRPVLKRERFVIDALLPYAYELSGHVAAEGRVFFNDALFPEQERNNASFSLEPEFYCEWENGSSLTFVPFARFDSADSERTHFDVRELNYLWLGDSWELRVGVGKVFWGVTEFTHLVDIINQTDAVESIDGEDKLGQPMVHLSIPRDWGVVDMFVLPWFRERTFPGQKGRLRLKYKVDTDNARFESAAEEHHVDLAMRYSHTIGDWDMGIYHFNGTGREPTLEPVPVLDNNFQPVDLLLIPFYEQINQTGLDLQLVEGEWLFKLEAIYRTGQMDSDRQEHDFFAGVGGLEYTFVRIAETYMDLGVIGEWAYDERGDKATTPSENDIMFGLRLSVNDAASTQLLAGVSQDLDNSSRVMSIEASRRFGDNWKATLEGMAFFGVPEGDLLYSLRDDDFVRLELAYYY